VVPTGTIQGMRLVCGFELNQSKEKGRTEQKKTRTLYDEFCPPPCTITPEKFPHAEASATSSIQSAAPKLSLIPGTPPDVAELNSSMRKGMSAARARDIPPRLLPYHVWAAVWLRKAGRRAWEVARTVEALALSGRGAQLEAGKLWGGCD
jgi:hypothetical protein